MQHEEEWFSTWFDSPYYHILYKNRDMQEAQRFIDKLIDYLHPKPDARLLDLACGRGRHSIYLNRKGYDVTGVDLSEHSIMQAKEHENERLQFFVHDMRDVFRPESFDFVLNLFTSFGYFETDTENVLALRAAAASLKHGGKLVVDFMNTDQVIDTLVHHETKEVEGILFHISRKVDNGFIVKTIRFEDKGKAFEYEERVRALREEDFRQYFRLTNLRLMDVFGDYNLGAFNRSSSERMIFVLKK